MGDKMTGGCQCGRVRYEVEIASDDAYWCHCRMCQKATGGIAAAFVQVESPITWLGEPDWYESSAVAKRPFCSACGTPLGFAWKTTSKGQDLTVGSFDDPSRFKPVAHAGSESMHEAWLNTKDLPHHYSSTTPSVVKHWQEAGLEVPE